MSKVYQHIPVTGIPDLQYDGYYWLSDAQKPVELTAEKLDTSIFGKLPFVVEANFYASTEKISIQVKHIDGAYQITKFDLREAKNITTASYLSHRTNAKKYFMVEGWEANVDPFLPEGMTTLVPAWSAFAGFER
ncbi:MAG: TIGR04423 family type III CRISPR-associated protein [Bacteroidota bacterium]